MIMYIDELIVVLEKQKKFKKNNEILNRIKNISYDLKRMRCGIVY